MTRMEHAFFGSLDVGEPISDEPDLWQRVEIVWQQQAELDGRVLPLWLWCDPNHPPEAGLLDKLAARVRDLHVLDAKARGYLAQALEQGDYMADHLDAPALDASPLIARLKAEAAGAGPSPAVFAAAMHLERVGLHAYDDADTDKAASIVLDYILDRDDSDEIMAVKLNADGALLRVDSES